MDKNKVSSNGLCPARRVYAPEVGAHLEQPCATAAPPGGTGQGVRAGHGSSGELEGTGQVVSRERTALPTALACVGVAALACVGVAALACVGAAAWGAIRLQPRVRGGCSLACVKAAA